MKMQDVKCIVFDCDNVLVDTETTLVTVMLDMLEGYGVQMEVEEAVRLFSGRQMAETLKFMEARSGKKFPDDFEQVFRKRLYDEFRKGVQPVKGAKALLESLQLPFCVASSGPREKIELNLGLTGLLPFFSPERIFSSYDIGSWKPEPGIFLHAAAVMGYQPSECVVIEDSLAGIAAGLAGGFRVYGLSNGYNQEELREQGALVIDALAELPDLLYPITTNS
jgi:HAD superfamily hydrolase (TIGR01509 family)